MQQNLLMDNGPAPRGGDNCRTEAGRYVIEAHEALKRAAHALSGNDPLKPVVRTHADILDMLRKGLEIIELPPEPKRAREPGRTYTAKMQNDFLRRL